MTAALEQLAALEIMTVAPEILVDPVTATGKDVETSSSIIPSSSTSGSIAEAPPTTVLDVQEYKIRGDIQHHLRKLRYANVARASALKNSLSQINTSVQKQANLTVRPPLGVRLHWVG